MADSYIVVCRLDRDKEDVPGNYAIATRRVFKTRIQAEKYAATVAQSREPIVVEGDFANLRFPVPPFVMANFKG